MRTSPVRRSLAVATLALASSLSVAPAAMARQDTARPYCGIMWGSQPKIRFGLTDARITNHRAGQQACFDRFVIVLRGAAGGYDARYVPRMYFEGSRFVMPMRGQIFIHVSVNAPVGPAIGIAGGDLVPTAGFRTFRQVSYAGRAGGHAGYGIGLRARMPFRVSILPGAAGNTLLVIDVAHAW
ncbi:MAG: hypothetical protein JWM05_3757 [Acidimicrobiales bacterium]|nr:hypothetical protein [Acidimicrobiales bacterium]